MPRREIYPPLPRGCRNHARSFSSRPLCDEGGRETQFGGLCCALKGCVSEAQVDGQTVEWVFKEDLWHTHET